MKLGFYKWVTHGLMLILVILLRLLGVRTNMEIRKHVLYYYAIDHRSSESQLQRIQEVVKKAV